MKELSIFIDESGDFGEITERPAYYLVTLLFHDQPQELKKTFLKAIDKKRLAKNTQMPVGRKICKYWKDREILELILSLRSDCMIKVIKKYTEVSMILFSIALLQISNLFQWDNNPIMGMDKVCADILIIVLCCLLIKKMGIQSGAGFIKKGFFKGILYGIPFLVIGVASIFVSNVGLDWGQLSFLGISHLVLFTINMILVGANEEIWMRSLVLNSFISKYGAGRKSLWKAIIMSAGILFAVIFVKCKNIWAGIMVHAIVDWCSLFVGNCFVGGNTVLSMSMNGIQAVSMILTGSLPPIIFSIIFMRKIEEP